MAVVRYQQSGDGIETILKFMDEVRKQPPKPPIDIE